MKFEHKKVIKKNSLMHVNASGNHIAYLWTNQVRSRWHLNHEPLEEGHEFRNFINSNEAIIMDTKIPERTIILNLATGDSRIINGIAGFKVIGDDKIIGTKLENEERKHFVADFLTGEILYEVPMSWGFLGEYGDYIFLKTLENEEYVVYAISIEDGEVKWKLKISDVPKIRSNNRHINQVLGIYDKNVLITVQWGGIVAVDIETGRISWQVIYITKNNSKISHIGNYKLRNPNIIYSQRFHLLGDKIYYLFDRQFGIIDLKNHRATIRLDLGDHLADQLYFSIIHNQHTKDMLKDIPNFNGGDLLIDRHIVAPVYDRQSAACPLIVAFDIDSEKIDWKYEEQKKYGGMRHLVYSGDRFLYCTDRKERLHTFERTE